MNFFLLYLLATSLVTSELQDWLLIGQTPTFVQAALAGIQRMAHCSVWWPRSTLLKHMVWAWTWQGTEVSGPLRITQLG